MVDKDKDRMNPNTASGQSSGNPSQAGSNQNMSGSGAGKMENAKQQAKAMASQAAEQGKTVVNQQKDTVAEQVDSVSGAIRGAAENLEQEGQPQTSHYVSMLADQIETLGRQLRNKDAGTLLRDAENLSRRAPFAFFAGALAVGFLASRFLKSSAERSYSEYGDSYGGSGRQGSDFDDTSYSWRNEMGEGERDENIGRNRTYSLDPGEGSLMADSAAEGTLGGQWGAGTNVAGPEITGIYRPSDTQSSSRPSGTRASTPGTELPSSAQPSVAADGKAQPGRPTDAIGGSVNSTSPTEPKSGGNIYGNR